MKNKRLKDADEQAVPVPAKTKEEEDDETGPSTAAALPDRPREGGNGVDGDAVHGKEALSEKASEAIRVLGASAEWSEEVQARLLEALKRVLLGPEDNGKATKGGPDRQASHGLPA